MLSTATKRSSTFGDSSNAESTDIVVNYLDSKSSTTAWEELPRLLNQTLSSFIREGSNSVSVL